MGEVVRLPLARIHDPGGCPVCGSSDGTLMDLEARVWAYCMFDATKWPLGKQHPCLSPAALGKNQAALRQFRQVRPVFEKPDGAA